MGQFVDPAALSVSSQATAEPAKSNAPKVVRRIALLAGSGYYPIHFAREARREGWDVTVIAIQGEADRRIARATPDVRWVPVGGLERVLAILQERQISQLVLIGKIHKTHLFAPVELDTLSRRVIASVPQRDDVSLLMAITREFERAGITVHDPTRVVKDLQVGPGFLTKTHPTQQQMADLRYGYTVAKDLARHGIGQTVVVKDGVILAVEAIEGTDRTISRARSLVDADLVVVKVGCPNQDRRFDMPVIGAETVKTLGRSRVKALGIDAANTIVVDRQAVLAEADRREIAVVAL
jgi:DUF1009 family protein